MAHGGGDDEAAGIETPPHMDGRSFIPLAQGKDVEWRENFLYIYYWEKNFPQSPTVFCLRGDKWKYITYYGLRDTDELYDIENDPNETHNVIGQHRDIAKRMENELYQMMGDSMKGGLRIPLNQPEGTSRIKRLDDCGGRQAGDFTDNIVVDEPINQNAH